MSWPDDVRSFSERRLSPLEAREYLETPDH
jgi:hypothetical protein